jgi:hypothetical protein
VTVTEECNVLLTRLEFYSEAEVNVPGISFPLVVLGGLGGGARGSVVVEALSYKPEVHGFKTQ